ncbi:MAG: DUF501 domain-containing protein [Acidimicrobiales bacterium]|nr:DUF501 domain-containing protein [Acidimicrobiales bacterium]
MTVAAILLAAGGGTRFAGPDHKLLALLGDRPVVSWALTAAMEAGFNEVIVVQGAVELSAVIEDATKRHGWTPTVIHNPNWEQGQATSLQLAVGHAREQGHSAIVVGLGDQPHVGVSPWRTVGATSGTIVAATFNGARRPPVKLDQAVWDRLPEAGDDGARVLMQAHPELVSEVPCSGDPGDIDTVDDLARAQQQTTTEAVDSADRRDDERDDEMVMALLGRAPMGRYSVAVRRHDRSPVVLSNAPLLADGTPMPTRFWLCDPMLVKAISHIESAGGVRRAEADVAPEAIVRTHAFAEAERNALIEDGYAGPRPFGGVGGTRKGVKCLHTHYANYLAGAPDVIGEWTERVLAAEGLAFDPSEPGVASQ